MHSSRNRFAVRLNSGVRWHMARFAVFARSVLVVYSALELGDAPMGVAFGVFEPLEAYASIQSDCASNHADQSNSHLSVRTETGVSIPCQGVGILDYSGQVEEPYAEVNVFGIPYPLYGQLFPEHVAAYDRQFR